MDLEHLTKLPYNGIYQRFYQYENNSRLHQIEYEYFKIEGTDKILVTAVPCSHKTVCEENTKSDCKWFK